jgi:carbamoyl-phosphate synthase large subunit
MRQNVLITSAGRRAKLVLAFRKELDQLLPGSEVYGADIRPDLSAACQLTHRSLTVPGVNDCHYTQRLVELCDANDIGLIIPTIDPELPVLARHREELAERGVVAIISGNEFVGACRDKRRTAQWFTEHGLQTPRLVDPHTTNSFPIFAKPYDGSSSHGACVVTSPSDLTPGMLGDPRMMFVEHLSPAEYEEYTVDMYFDRRSVLQCLVPRLRLETRAGEVSKGRTKRIPAMHLLRDRLGTIEGVRGCITLQLFVHRQSQDAYAIEINPRFGGGYPLSYEAGANFPRWLIQEYLLDMPVGFYDDWECDLTMLRYDDHVIVRGAAA